MICDELLSLMAEQKQEVTDLIYEILQKSQHCSKYASFSLNAVVQKLLVYSTKSQFHQLTFDLLIYLTAITKNLVKFDFDATNNFSLILRTLKESSSEKRHWNLLLDLLAEILQVCSPTSIPDLVKILKFIIIDQKVGNEVSLLMVQDGIIQILAYPSFVQNLQGAENLLNYISDENWVDAEDPERKDDLDLRVLSSHPDIKRFYEIGLWLASKELILKDLKTNGDELFWSQNSLILRGLFLSKSLEFPEWKRIFKILLKISQQNESIRNKLIMPMLYKLANETDPKFRMEILQNMTTFGFKDQIFNTIKIVSKTLVKSFAIDLYLKLWIVEPRTYPFLIKILAHPEKSSGENDVELGIVRAAAIREICRMPQQHGTDLVNLISDILNNSFDERSELAASLALESICILCQNHVINPVSTWKAISFKLRYEKRDRVIKSMCKFFGIIPLLKSPTLTYEDLYKEILEKLWNYILFSEKKETMEYALKALENYNPEEMTLDLIPECFREGFKLPDPVAEENGEKTFCVLDMEVPGDCFFQILQKCNPLGIKGAKSLLIHRIREEIDGFRNSVYVVPENQPEPITLKLTKKSVLKALVDFLVKQVTSKKISEKPENLMKMCLEILADKFSKPIPPLNWCFLHDLLHVSPEIKALSLKIAAKQSIISGTSKRLIENFLLNVDPENNEEILLGFEMLDDLVNGISGGVLKTFLDFGFDRGFKLLAGEKGTLLYEIIETSRNSLVDLKKVTKEENLFIVTSIFSKFLNQIDLNSKIFDTYVEMILVLPPNYVHSLTAFHPDLEEIRFQKNIVIRCGKMMKYKIMENQIAWLNEMVSAGMNFDDRKFLLQNLISLLIENDNLPKKALVVDIIGGLQIKMTEEFEFDDIKFQLDILVLTLILTSGYQNVVQDLEILTSNIFTYKLFPACLHSLSRQGFWEDVMVKVRKI